MESRTSPLTRQLLPERKSTVDKLNNCEKLEFITQGIIIAFTKAVSGYYALDVLHENQASLQIALATLYTIIGSCVSMRSTYQLGPYFANVHDLEILIQQFNAECQQFEHHNIALDTKILTIRNHINAIARQENLFIVNEYRLNPDAKYITSISHHTILTKLLSVFAFVWDAITGVSVGMNLNTVANISSPFNFISPAILSFIYAIFNKLIFSAIQSGNVILPSQIMMVHLKDRIHYSLEQIIQFNLQYRDMHMDKIYKIQSILSPYMKINNEQKEVAIPTHVHVNIVSHQKSHHITNSMLTLTNMLPLLFSILCAVIALDPNKDSVSKKPNFYAPMISAAVVVLCILFAWRYRQYNHSEGLRKFNTLEFFSSDQLHRKIKTLDLTVKKMLADIEDLASSTQNISEQLKIRHVPNDAKIYEYANILVQQGNTNLNFIVDYGVYLYRKYKNLSPPHLHDAMQYFNKDGYSDRYQRLVEHYKAHNDTINVPMAPSAAIRQ